MTEKSETPAGGSETGTNDATRKTRERVFSKYPLPSDRTTFEVHFEVVRRFVTMARGGEGIEASKVESDPVPVQGAQMNVRFLRSIGLLNITERGRYAPTPEAIRFINAKSVSDDAAASILAELLRKSWIGEVTQSTLSTRPGMSSDQFLGELALAAETDKGKRMNSLQTVLEYVLYARLVTRDSNGGLLLAGGQAEPSGLVAGFDPAITAATTSARALGIPTTSGQRSAPSAAGWHTVQTEDFALRVRMDNQVIEDLEAYLDLLKDRLKRVAPSAPGPASAPSSTPSA